MLLHFRTLPKNSSRLIPTITLLPLHRRTNMSKSKVDSKHKEKRDKLQQDVRQQQGRCNLGQPTPRDFANQLSQQLDALKQTFNEAKEANYSLQNRNVTVDEGMKEVLPRRESASDDADENTGNTDTCSCTNDSTDLEGRCTKEKRTSSNAASDNQSQETAQIKRSRTLPSSIS
jgi:hypothetical protein